MTGRISRLAPVLLVTLVLQACASGAIPTVPAQPSARLLAPTQPTAHIVVAPDGNDENPGTADRPVQSIERAAALARPGTEVDVAPGTYPASVLTTVSGTAQARIAFVSPTQGAARIVADGSATDAWKNTGDYVDIVGFDVSGPNEDGLTNGGSYVRIVGNRVHDFTKGNCIATASDEYQLHDIDVLGNTTSGCGKDELDHGIYVSHPRGVVANNVSYANAGYGIHCWHNCNELDVSNNLVFDNATGGILIGQGDGPNYGDVAADDFVVANNIVVGNGHSGVREGGTTGPNNQYLNNLLWNNGDDDIELDSGSSEGTITADPGFVDFRPDGTGDYHLRPDSPGVDAGVPTGAPPMAIDGAPRPLSGGVDIGVYER